MIKLQRSQRVDWFQILLDLHRHGLSFASISKKTAIPATTLKGWKYQTGRPKFEEALIVIEFWCEKTGKQPADIPVADMYSH